MVALNGGRGLDIAIVTSGAVTAYQTALSILEAEGRLAAVGLLHGPLPLVLSLVTGKATQ
jgi:propanol-preferring alcohol dehydrogenase